MKVLFVCWANVGRSQMAKALYNHTTHSHDADAAGTEVEVYGESLADRYKRRGGTQVLEAMSEIGMDVSAHEQTQLVEDMLDRYDQVISMADHPYTPDWLRNHPKFEYWHIEDPGGKGLDATRAAREAIKIKVEDLIRGNQGKL